MKIIVTASSYPVTADESINAGVFVRDIVAQLAMQGHDVQVLTPDKGTEITGSPAPVTVFSWGGAEKVITRLKPKRPGDLLRLLRIMLGGRRALKRLDRSFKPDVVIAMWAIPSGFWATGLKCPYMVWVLGSDIWSMGRYPLGSSIVRHVLRGASHLFGNSMYLVEEVNRMVPGRTEFLAAGRRLPVAETPAASLPQDGPQLVFVGRWDRVKGIDVLLDAMGRTIDRLPGIHLHLFGGGPLESEIREQATQGRLREHVTVYGFAEADDVVAYCKACDALLIPSRQESMPIIYSDAVQCGCPVVATDVGDLGRFVREQKTGIVCPPEDPDALAEAIYTMVTSDLGPRKAYAHALSEAAEIFDPAHNAARLVEVASTLNSKSAVQSNQ